MRCCYLVFFFNDTATTEIYTLSLHDALPIFEDRPLFDAHGGELVHVEEAPVVYLVGRDAPEAQSVSLLAYQLLDRKSTRLNSSHANISYAVFCLKKKKKTTNVLYNLN